MKRNWLKVSSLLAILMIFGMLFVAVIPVQAAEIIDDDGNVPVEQTIDDDLLIAHDLVIIDGTVTGTVVALGERIILNGTVEGDLIAFGGTLEIGTSGYVGGNLFAGVGEAMIQGSIDGSIFAGAGNVLLRDGAASDGNLYIGAFNLSMDENTHVARDLYFGGMQTSLAGEITQDAFIAAEAADLIGIFGGDVRVEMSSTEAHDTYVYNFTFQEMRYPITPMTGGLNIADDSRIAGKLTIVSSAANLSALDNQPEGGVIVQTPVPQVDEDGNQQQWQDDDHSFRPTHFAWRWLRNNLGRFMALAMLGSLMLWLCRKPFIETVDLLRQQPWLAFGYGAASTFGGYFAAFMAVILILIATILIAILSFGKLGSAAATLGFSGLGVVFTAFTLSVTYLSKLVIAFWLGRVILKPQDGENAGRAWLAALIGITLYVVARAIPVLGWFIGVTATFFGLGAIVMWCYRWWQNRRGNKPAKHSEVLAVTPAPVETLDVLDLGDGGVDDAPLPE